MAMQVPIENRETAGKALAEQLLPYRNRKDVIVLALPRGGVPVAFEIARALKVNLDLLLVRKLGTPSFPELAMGAIASGDIKVLNPHVIQAYAITQTQIDEVEVKERAELHRRQHAYRGQRPVPNLTDQVVIIVDDGLATGATMHAAIDAVRLQSPQKIVVAVPVAPPETINALRDSVDEVVCPIQPHQFSSIGQWYQSFSQVSDQEVTDLLNSAWSAA